MTTWCSCTCLCHVLPGIMAVAAINEAIDSQDPAETLKALQMPAAGMREVEEPNAVLYQRLLQAEKEKKGQVSGRCGIVCLNPILTGGGVNLTPPPPCTKSVTVLRPPLIATRLFMTFFFQVLRIFWYQVCENRTIGREVTRRFVLARRLKNCRKICILHMFVYKTHGNYWFS